jgi:D-alanyl-D-alanine endopeptidase (penicillin-binding protein 7)
MGLFKKFGVLVVMALVLSSGQAGGRAKSESAASKAWAVVDASGRLIGGQGHDVAHPIASITKMMMAMAYLDAKPNLGLLETIDELDIDTLKNSSSRLPVGARLPRSDLLMLALASSENRAASALARSYPGGSQAMVVAMNEKAKVLGMSSAKFVDPTGLSPENIASARDVAWMALEAKSYAFIRQAAQTTQYDQSVAMKDEDGKDKSLLILYKNTNKPLREGKIAPLVSKTGYIKEAGKCLAWAIEGKASTVGLSILGASSFSARDAQELRLTQWAMSKKEPKSKSKKVKG